MTGVLHIIPQHSLSPNSLGVLSSKSVLFAEEGGDIKTGRETDVTVLSFLIEGAGREKLFPARLSLKSNT